MPHCNQPKFSVNPQSMYNNTFLFILAINCNIDFSGTCKPVVKSYGDLKGLHQDANTCADFLTVLMELPK